MEQYTVTGMSCAACSARVEKAVRKVPGVTDCAVSLLTNSMGVEGTATPAEIVKAVEDAGYGAMPRSGAAGAGSVPGSSAGFGGHVGAGSVASGAVAGSGGASAMAELNDALKDRETPILKRRLATSVAVLLVLMYFSMGHMMLGWSVPAFLENHVALALVEMFLALAIMVINGKFFTSGFKSLLHGAPNMDTLVALGSAASFGYSLAELFLMVDAMGKGDHGTVHRFAMDLYFESAAMIPTLITVGKLLESMSKGKTTDALKELLALAPKTATVLRPKDPSPIVEVTDPMESASSAPAGVAPPAAEGADGVATLAVESAGGVAAVVGSPAANPVAAASGIAANRMEVEIPVERVVVGDLFVVRPGDSIPVDGIIEEGASAVDESAITGESIPVDKLPGDVVTAATINKSGFMICRATRVGEDTTLAQIIRMVSDAAATKAPLARIADKVSAIFVPAVIALAVLTWGAWLLLGKDFGFAIARGISVLVISCPCALGLATPVAIMVGNGVGAKNGILYKTAQAQEETGRVQIIALDKTGTITRGVPKVTDVVAAEGMAEGELLRIAAGLEEKSEHPLAKAVVDYTEENSGITPAIIRDFSALPGNGLVAKLGEKDPAAPVGGDMHDLACLAAGDELLAGNLDLMTEKGIPLDEALLASARAKAEQGKTPLFFAAGGKSMGLIAVADTLKEDSAAAIKELKAQGLKVVMLTGDNERTAKAIGEEAGVDLVIAGVKPDEKERVIRELQEKGKVAMVGDGINDAPALTRADVGIAIGAGTDVAIDAADVVVMQSRLSDVAAAIRLSRGTIRNIHQNLFWAFFYNIICIPLAMGLYGIAMKPMYGAAAMALSSFFVCMNALRLNLFKVHDGSKDRPQRASLKGPLTISSVTDADTGVTSKEAKEILSNTKEEKTMKKTMNIEGMMCMHCEARVKKALEALDGVSEAVVSHEAGTAVVEMGNAVDDAVLTKAVEDEDYKVISIA